ncbi:MAG: helix-turn-helix transcriptional regulator [Desulfobacteraceae bacterium]|nr:helix-turn-helix transcriptional regulator [Desulfobacteraceae bacterium]
MTIRKRIEIECCRFGISRAELARRVGKLPQALNDMLSRGDMRASLLKEIATELGVTMERLMAPIDDKEYMEIKQSLMEKRRESGNTEAASDFFG